MFFHIILFDCTVWFEIMPVYAFVVIISLSLFYITASDAFLLCLEKICYFIPFTYYLVVGANNSIILFQFSKKFDSIFFCSISTETFFAVLFENCWINGLIQFSLHLLPSMSFAEKHFLLWLWIVIGWKSFPLKTFPLYSVEKYLIFFFVLL